MKEFEEILDLLESLYNLTGRSHEIIIMNKTTISIRDMDGDEILDASGPHDLKVKLLLYIANTANNMADELAEDKK